MSMLLLVFGVTAVWSYSGDRSTIETKNRRDYGDSLLILVTVVILSRKPSTSIGGGDSHTSYVRVRLI
jgi:hypothetical protein